MEKKTLEELLESDELLLDVGASSTAAAFLYQFKRSPIVRNINERIYSNPTSNIEFIENYLEKTINLQVDGKYLHPKTIEICVCMALLEIPASIKGAQLIKQLALDGSPKFFYCAELARTLLNRMGTNNSREERIPSEPIVTVTLNKLVWEGISSPLSEQKPKDASYAEVPLAS